MSKPRARRVVTRSREPEPIRAPVEAHEEAEMAEWGESTSASDAPVVNNPRPAPKGEVSKDKPGDWLYGGIAYPVLPDPPKPVLKVFREHVVTGEIEFKDAPEPDPEKPDLPPPTAKQVWGLEPMPGAEPASAPTA